MPSMSGYPIIQTVGLYGFLVTFGTKATDAANRAAIAYRRAIDDLEIPEIAESSTTLASAFFRVDLVEHSDTAIRDSLQQVLESRDWLNSDVPSRRKLWTIPAVFGGAQAPQLADAAAAAGLSEQEAQEDLVETRQRVLTLGFAPGQPYLGILNQHWNIPRQQNLSRRVPKGALVVAMRQMCLFSNDTPTGWLHIGQTNFQCFAPNAEVPFPLTPGDEIQFLPVSPKELAQLQHHQLDGVTVEDLS